MLHDLSSLFFSVASALVLVAAIVVSKSTIEPCAGHDSCPALLGYTLYTDLKVSQVAALFQTDPAALLAANAFDAVNALQDAANRILPAGLFLRVPTACSCADGIRRSVSVRYRVRPVDTLASIADSVFSGLAAADQIREANGITSDDPTALDVGRSLVIPLPCTCFNSSDNGFPAVYLSYVVLEGDTVQVLAARYATTVTDIMNANSMGIPSVRPGDILAIPLPACASMFPSHATDFGLIVANSTYTITAGHCVQCSCDPGNLNFYCTPASLPVSCSSMQCGNSSLMIGNITVQPTSAGCKVTSCDYNGFVNGSIITKLTSTLQPQCPGKPQFPKVMPLPTTVIHASFLPPTPSPVESQPGLILPAAPRLSLPGTFTLPGTSPSIGPAAESFASSQAHLDSLLNLRWDMVVLSSILVFLL